MLVHIHAIVHFWLVFRSVCSSSVGNNCNNCRLNLVQLIMLRCVTCIHTIIQYHELRKPNTWISILLVRQDYIPLYNSCVSSCKSLLLQFFIEKKLKEEKKRNQVDQKTALTALRSEWSQRHMMLWPPKLTTLTVYIFSQAGSAADSATNSQRCVSKLSFNARTRGSST